MTRSEHMDWAKKRALAYLPDDPQQAFTSMASDLSKHDETKGHSGIELGMMLLMTGNLSGSDQMRDFINGFH